MKFKFEYNFVFMDSGRIVGKETQLLDFELPPFKLNQVISCDWFKISYKHESWLIERCATASSSFRKKYTFYMRKCDEIRDLDSSWEN